jgi:hypothetical protein
MIFHPGGLYADGSLISGELGSVHADAVSHEIHDVFRSHFFAGFAKVWDYRVGPDAMRLFESGRRLTPGVLWSKDADLRIPGN